MASRLGTQCPIELPVLVEILEQVAGNTVHENRREAVRVSDPPTFHAHHTRFNCLSSTKFQKALVDGVPCLVAVKPVVHKLNGGG